jgi:hypothetical protein
VRGTVTTPPGSSVGTMRDTRCPVADGTELAGVTLTDLPPGE